MPEITTKNIRNVCLLGHGSSGKTSLAEAMLFCAGAIDRMGKVTDGNTVTDYDPEETARHYSVSLSTANFIYHDIKINLLDTPGYPDFIGEELEGIRAAIDTEDSIEMNTYFTNAKNYRDSLTVRQSGPIQPVYELYCDLIDEVGGIATIATLLASNGINIKNIGILHNREYEDGVLHIELYHQQALNAAHALLVKYHYTVYQRS